VNCTAERDRQRAVDSMASWTPSGMASRHPLVLFSGLALVLSAAIVAVLLAVGLAEDLFVLGTFGPGIAAVVTVGLLDGRSHAWRFVKSSMSP
jgi:hypothetical protein